MWLYSLLYMQMERKEYAYFLEKEAFEGLD